MEAAEEVLADDWLVSRDDVQRPVQSEEEIVSEFSEKVGFPSPASRVWEHASPSSVVSQGTGLSSVCRSSGPASKGSSDGASEKTVTAPGKPLGRLLRRPPMKMGWRGPLPRPRITPPPCLGDFFLEFPPVAVQMDARAAPAASAAIMAVSASSAAGDVDPGAVQTELALTGGAQLHDGVSRRSPPAHLCRWFEGLWRRCTGGSKNLALGSSPRPIVLSPVRTPPSLLRSVSPVSCSRIFRSLSRSFAEVASASHRMAAPPPGFGGQPGGPPPPAAAAGSQAWGRGAAGVAAFGAMAGPAAVVPRQLGAGQQVQAVAAGALPPPGFAFGAVAQAPKRKKKKKTNGAAGQAQVQQQGQVQAGGQALILGGQQAIPAVVQPAIAPAAPTVAVV